MHMIFEVILLKINKAIENYRMTLQIAWQYMFFSTRLFVAVFFYFNFALLKNCRKQMYEYYLYLRVSLYFVHYVFYDFDSV